MKTKNVLLMMVASLSFLFSVIGNGAGRDFQSLDGAWQIVFDRYNEGGAKQWIREKNFPREQTREIAVPSCWKLMEKDYEGVSFYRRAFNVPANWAGKTIRLQFDAVNFRSEVRLIATGAICVKDVFIEPKISDNTATLHLELAHEGKKAGPATVTIAIRSVSQPDRVAATISKTLDLKPGLNRQAWTLDIPDAAYWSPDHPHLYRAEVSVAFGGTVSDRWETRFGMREFTIRDKKFCLNGKPLYLKATFFEGLYPVKLAYPDSREMAIREIQLAKDAGFNMIRPWRKTPPMWLDLADEMGVLTVGSPTWQSFPSARPLHRLPTPSA